MIKTTLFAAAAAIATIATSAPVLADQVTVNYKDLDLASPDGQTKLAKRLDKAAREACGYDIVNTGSRLPSNSARECYKQAQVSSRQTMATILEQSRKGG